MSEVYYIVPRISEEDNTYVNWLRPSFNKIGVDLSKICMVFGNGGIHSKFNTAINSMKVSNLLKDEDIVVFLHDDVKFVNTNVELILKKIYSKLSDVGVCGVIGSTTISNNCVWWEHDSCVRGSIVQHKKDGTSFKLKRNPDQTAYDNIFRVAVVDGLFLSAPWSFLKNHNFDENLTGYHMYDWDLCFSTMKVGLKNYVIPIEVEHKSIGEGSLGTDFKESVSYFQNKWESDIKNGTFLKD